MGDSQLNSNEVAFPRGGASALTPLEVKEIHHRAARDVLFEAADQNKRKKLAKPTQRKKAKRAPTSDATAEEDEETIIEHLLLKLLPKGTPLLGQIVHVGKHEMAVAVTDNVMGYVSIAHVSPEVTAQIEAYEDAEALDDDDDDDEDGATIANTVNPAPELTKLFKVGQWVRTVVSSNEVDDKLGKRRLQLSVEPQEANQGMDADDMVVNNLVQVSVALIEDHGAIVTTGINKVHGFIPHKHLDFTPQVGQVLLAQIELVKNRAVTLKRAQPMNKKLAVTTISQIDAVRPGMVVSALVALVLLGLACRLFGMMDGSVALSQLHIFDDATLTHNYAVGQPVTARVVGVVEREGVKRALLSVLDLVANLDATVAKQAALEAWPQGSRFEAATVVGADADFIYVKLSADFYGQVHKLAVDPLAALDIALVYLVGSTHRARVTGYNDIDQLFTLTMDPLKIDCQYMSVGDIPLGATVPVEIVDVEGEGKGIKVKLVSGGFDGYVAPAQVSDVKLVYPERKFRPGLKQVARVVGKRGGSVYLTLKKLLLAMDEDDIISNVDNVVVGQKLLATVERFVPNGAIVAFFGNVKAYLPKHEILELFVDNASDVLRVGQLIPVTILSKQTVDEQVRITVTRRQLAELGEQQRQAMATIVPGHFRSQATVVERTKDAVVVELADLGLHGTIPNGLLSDGNYEQNQALAKLMATGSTVEVLVVEKDPRFRSVTCTTKPLMLSGVVPSSFDEVEQHVGDTLSGYVKLVTLMGLFVAFANRCVGLVLARHAAGANEDLAKAYSKYQLVLCRVFNTDVDNQRFLLTLGGLGTAELLVNPVNKTKKLTLEYTDGCITKGRIREVTPLHLVVALADNCVGRVDALVAFDSYDEVTDAKHPLLGFKEGKKIKVKVLGLHRPRKGRGMPQEQALQHQVFDLALGDPKLKLLNEYKPGDKVVAFVNGIHSGYAWVSLLPSVTGRVSLIDISDEPNHEVALGEMVHLTVVSTDAEHNIVNLSGRLNPITLFDDVKVGQKLPCRVVKAMDVLVLVELGTGVVALAYITDAVNDYTETRPLPELFPESTLLECTVIDLDHDAKRIAVSLRTDPKDPTINSVADLEVGKKINGYIKSIGPQGVYVALGRLTYALVRVSDLSDEFLADWKKHFKQFQPVTGKITECRQAGRVLMTLKDLEVNGNNTLFKKFDDINVGDVCEGTVRKATDFGVFVKLDGYVNLLGLCHKLEISDAMVNNPLELFSEGDRVKVIVLRKNVEKRQLSLGMKALYFTEDNDDEEDDEDEVMAENDDDEEDEDVVMEEAAGDDAADSSSDDDDNAAEAEATTGLATLGFDWTALILDQINDASDLDSDDDEDFMKKKKRSKKQKVEDKTGDLSTRAPESVADFERLIVGNPNSSVLWMNYMSFQLQLSEVDRAREIGHRALKTIAYREEQEKMNIWIALLNLENTFGSEETLEATFKDACQYMDSYVMHQKLVGIYTMLDKHSAADDVYQQMVKKFGKEHLSVWTHYGEWLMDRNRADDARELLARALLVLPKRNHIEVVRKFAQMEFARGHQEQGRTLFEGLVQDAPKRIDLWNVYIDQEIKDGDKEKAEDLFDRVLAKKITKKQAKFFFGKWLEYEEKMDDTKMQERVKAKAKAYVEAQQ